ncbi:hypothetical protein [Marinobacterium rhizophilum]|uniref:hypothetical protein n=1 Tax=Marinobacterium rhizophilum TaxID=420402 RepID=UPI00036D7C77|nr:hypothetical protein [Marinobacterium rhizophilum]
MGIFKRVFSQLLVLCNVQTMIGDSMPKQPDPRTLKDIGVDRMAAEHLRNERLWRELAS